MVQFFRENLHQLKKIPARLDGIPNQDRCPPDNRQSGKPDHPVRLPAVYYWDGCCFGLSALGRSVMWKLSTPGTRARLLPFSQFTWICPASSTISTLPFKPGGMWLSPSILLSVTSVPGGYLLRMASILSCVIFLYICTTSFLHLPLPRYGRYLDFMIFNRTLSIPSE